MAGDDSLPEWWDAKSKKKTKERKSVLERMGLAKGAGATAKKDDPSWWHDGDDEPPSGEGSAENTRAPAPHANSAPHRRLEDGAGSYDAKDEHIPGVKEEPNVVSTLQTSEAAVTFVEDSVDDVAVVKPTPASTQEIDGEGPKSNEDLWEQKGSNRGDQSMPEWWDSQKDSRKMSGGENVPDWWNNGSKKERKQRKSVLEKMRSSRGRSSKAKKSDPSWWHSGPEESNFQEYVKAQDRTLDTNTPSPQASSRFEQRDARGEEDNTVDGGRMNNSQDGSAEQEKERKSIQGSVYLSDSEQDSAVDNSKKGEAVAEENVTAEEGRVDEGNDGSAEKEKRRKSIQGSFYLSDNEQGAACENSQKLLDSPGADGNVVAGSEDGSSPAWWHENEGKDNSAPTWWHEMNKRKSKRASVFDRKHGSHISQKGNPIWWD